MRSLFFVLTLISSPALAQVEIQNAWAPATPPGARVGGGYMEIRNSGSIPDRLVGADSPVSERVEMHVSKTEGGIMKMRQSESLEVPAEGELVLKPGSRHLMFVELKRPFEEGDMVPVTLRFQRAGEVKTQLHVGRIGARKHRH